MKRSSLLTILLLILITSLTLAQPTTLEEYNYCIKGYKIAIDQGLKVKQEYLVKDVLNNIDLKNDNLKITVNFKELYRVEQTKPCALIMILRRDETPHYICIPTPDASPEITDLAIHQLDSFWDKEEAKTYFIAMSWGLMNLSGVLSQR